MATGFSVTPRLPPRCSPSLRLARPHGAVPSGGFPRRVVARYRPPRRRPITPNDPKAPGTNTAQYGQPMLPLCEPSGRSKAPRRQPTLLRQKPRKRSLGRLRWADYSQRPARRADKSVSRSSDAGVCCPPEYPADRPRKRRHAIYKLLTTHDSARYPASLPQASDGKAFL